MGGASVPHAPPCYPSWRANKREHVRLDILLSYERNVPIQKMSVRWLMCPTALGPHTYLAREAPCNLNVKYVLSYPRYLAMLAFSRKSIPSFYFSVDTLQSGWIFNPQIKCLSCISTWHHSGISLPSSCKKSKKAMLSREAIPYLKRMASNCAARTT